MKAKRPPYRPRDLFGSSPSAREHRAVLDALSELPAVARAEDVATAIGVSLAEAVRKLQTMDRVKLVETWPDPKQPHRLCVMLSETTAKRLGLTISTKGDRWMMTGDAAQELMIPDFGKFAWVAQRSQRRSLLVTIRSQLRKGWFMSADDRGLLRLALVWLKASGEATRRDLDRIEEVLPLLEADATREKPKPVS